VIRLLAALAALVLWSGYARAQEVVDDEPAAEDEADTGVDYLPAGTTIRIPEGDSDRTVVLDAGHYLLDRDALNRALGDHLSLQLAGDRLRACERRSARKSAGWSALRWGLVGAGVALAGAAGVWAGSKL